MGNKRMTTLQIVEYRKDLTNDRMSSREFSQKWGQYSNTFLDHESQPRWVVNGKRVYMNRREDNRVGPHIGQRRDGNE